MTSRPHPGTPGCWMQCRCVWRRPPRIGAMGAVPVVSPPATALPELVVSPKEVCCPHPVRVTPPGRRPSTVRPRVRMCGARRDTTRNSARSPSGRVRCRRPPPGSMPSTARSPLLSCGTSPSGVLLSGALSFPFPPPFRPLPSGRRGGGGGGDLPLRASDHLVLRQYRLFFAGGPASRSAPRAPPPVPGLSPAKRSDL